MMVVSSTYHLTYNSGVLLPYTTACLSTPLATVTPGCMEEGDTHTHTHVLHEN